MRAIASTPMLLFLLVLPGCGRSPAPERPTLTRAALAAIESEVVACTAATGRLTPLIARGDRRGLMDAAIDARNRCSVARQAISARVKPGAALDICRRDVDAQERISIAEIAALDLSSDERRQAVVAALDTAIPLQQGCAQAVAQLRGGQPG